MDSNLEMSLCQMIENGLKAEYDMLPELTDTKCALALDNAVIALKQQCGFAKNETVRNDPELDGIVAGVVAVGLAHIGKAENLTLKDYVAVVNKIRKSVIRHSSEGPRAYYHFVRQYV